MSWADDLEEIDSADLLSNPIQVPFMPDIPVVEMDYSKMIMTPQRLYEAYEMKQSDYSEQYFQMKLIPCPGFKTFKLFPSSRCTNFHNGHPMGKLTPGTRIVGYCHGGDYSGVVEKIDINLGTVTFMEMIVVPSLCFDKLGGDIEKKKIFDCLLNLDEMWGKPDRLITEVFLKKKRNGGDPTEHDPLVYTQGVVGSGKSYQLSLDVAEHRRRGEFQLVVAATNKALESVGREIEDRGLRVAQFTNKDTFFAFSVVFKDNPDFKEWKHWQGRKVNSEYERAQRKQARVRFKDLLGQFVILVTPSKAHTLRKALQLEDDIVSVYVDEAGLLKFINFCTVLAYKTKRIWIYGDHEQNEPFDENKNRDLPQNLYFRRASVICSNVGDQSLAKWFSEMELPGRFLGASRRLPVSDSSVLVPFFYEGAENWLEASRWLQAKVPSLQFRVSEQCWVPPSINAYEFMTSQQKNREASRMCKYLTWFRDETWVLFDSEQWEGKRGLAIISPYNHLRLGFREMWYRHFPELDEYWEPSFVTSFLVQGATFDYSLFYGSYSPGPFVTDKHLLVGWSRHRYKMFVAPFVVRNIVPVGILVQMHKLGIVVLTARPVKFGKGNMRSLGANKCKVTVNVTSYRGLQDFFGTKQFEFYRVMTEYFYLDDVKRKNLRMNFLVDDALVESYLENPAREIKVLGAGQFKYILMRLLQEEYMIDSQPTAEERWLCMDGKWRARNHAVGGVELVLGAVMTSKKQEKRIVTIADRVRYNRASFPKTALFRGRKKTNKKEQFASEYVRGKIGGYLNPIVATSAGGAYSLFREGVAKMQKG